MVVQGIKNLLWRSINNYYGMGEIKSNHTVIWKCIVNGNIIRLYHYNTLICTFHKEKKIILEYYGQSMTDRNAIDTILELYCENDTRKVSYSQGVVKLS